MSDFCQINLLKFNSNLNLGVHHGNSQRAKNIDSVAALMWGFKDEIAY